MYIHVHVYMCITLGAMVTIKQKVKSNNHFISLIATGSLWIRS